MDPRMMMPQAQFPFYPLTQLGQGAVPKQTFQSGMAFVGSTLGFAHSSALGMQQNNQPWMYNSTSPAVSSPFLNSAQQTAMLLARLHHGQMQHQDMKMPSFDPASICNLPLLLASTKDKMVEVPIVTVTKKRSLPDLESGAKQPKLVTADSEDSGSEKDAPKAQGLRGERRLVIAFENLGTKGANPQTFGKSGALIPDGVSGTHTVYNERWRFEVTHGKEVFTVEKMKCVCITWSVTNLTTGMVTSMTETRDEAVIRNSQGQTISNKVFREALENRARDLERRLQEETNPKRVSQIEALIRGLRPKRFSEGPLIFGLQHKIVQDKMTETAVA